MRAGRTIPVRAVAVSSSSAVTGNRPAKGSLLKLFDEQDRTDPAPCREGEDSFSFLNRVDTAFWAQVRDLLESFFRRYPAEHSESLRRDFRARLPGRHYAAWWELYLHELFLRLGYEITIHPAIDGTERKPDFGLRRNNSNLLVEASVVFSGIAGGEEETGAAPSWMLAAFEDLKNPNFFVSIHEITARGDEQLKRTEITSPIQVWLASLDPDQVAIELEAWPVKPAARGRPGHRVLGSGPAMGGWVDDMGQLESKLKVKAGRYGRPEVPYVIAVLSLSGFMERLDVEQALFGREAVVIADPKDSGRLIRQENGFWFRGGEPINTRVSAVLMGVGLQPWSITRAAPELWINPWAEHPLAEDWPFAVHTALETGEVVYEEKDLGLAALFDLLERWPEGKPFPRD